MKLEICVHDLKYTVDISFKSYDQMTYDWRVMISPQLICIKKFQTRIRDYKAITKYQVMKYSKTLWVYKFLSYKYFCKFLEKYQLSWEL